MDYLTLGPTPVEESCAQVGDPEYDSKARDECRRFIKQLRETFGPEPAGARLGLKAFQHDFGVYYEVVCWFDETSPEAMAYAYRLEAELPARWTNGALSSVPA